MSYTVDANVLLYASDDASPYHARAMELLREMAAGPEIAYLLWPTIIAYLRIATHPTVFRHPLSIAEAVTNMDGLLQRPHIRTAGEGGNFWSTFRAVAVDSLPAGNVVADAHLASLMIENGVRLIWTRDRDFRRFRRIEARDPFG